MMRRALALLVVSGTLLLTIPAHAGLIDQFNLAGSVLFQDRVRQAIVAASVAIYNEAPTAKYQARALLAKAVINNPATFLTAFTAAVANDSAVAIAAGAVTPSTADTQQALATDTQINNAVATIWNVMAGA